MNNRRKLYALAATAVAAEVAGYLAWRPRMLRWGTEGDESTEKLPGDDLVPLPGSCGSNAGAGLRRPAAHG